MRLHADNNSEYYLTHRSPSVMHAEITARLKPKAAYAGKLITLNNKQSK